MTDKKNQSLEALLAQAEHAYHTSDTLIVSDDMFDALQNTAQQQGRATRVGADPKSNLPKITHAAPMLSLDNAFDDKDFNVFTQRVQKLLAIDTFIPLFAEPKIDGLSLSLYYAHGMLMQAATRGNGTMGEDVTAQVRTIASIPQQLQGAVPESLYVRGEVYMRHDDFAALNALRAQHNESLFVNARNAAAGSLRMLDIDEVARRRLCFFAYALADNTTFAVQQHDALRDFLSHAGFEVVPHGQLCLDASACTAHYEHIKQQRAQLPFDIDGVVFKINDFTQRQHVGYARHAPKWAVAYKFAARRAATVLRNIVLQVGRTGALTPVALLDPVQVAGVTITAANVHNADYIAQRDLRIGDTVIVERAGDVIPQVVEPVLPLRDAQAMPFVFPKQCPACGTQATPDDDDAAVWRCRNTQCQGRLHALLSYVLSRNVFNIDGLGEKHVEHLLASGLVQRVADIFALTREDLLSLPKFAEKLADKVYNAIEQQKTMPAERFWMALNIPHVGETTARHLAQKYRTLDDLVHAVHAAQQSPEAMEQLAHIGEYRLQVVAHALCRFVASDMTDAYALQARIKLIHAPAVGQGEDSMVFTGTLSQSRTLIQQRARAAGFLVHSAVSARTTYLVCGTDAGSKRKKAEQLGVQVIDEQQFEELLRMRAQQD